MGRTVCRRSRCRVACLRLLARRRSRAGAVRRALLARARHRADRRRLAHRRRRGRVARRTRRRRRRSRRRHVYRVRAGRRVRRRSRCDRCARARACAGGRRLAARRPQPQRSSRDDAAAVRARPGDARRAAGARRSRAPSRNARSGALEDGTLLAATTHWQPAQPVSLAFWLDAAAQGFVRAAARFARVAHDAARFCPLGSSALAGSSLPLDRVAAARELGFAEPSRNALDTVGDRDVALDLLHAAARAVVAASRPSEEFVLWTTPAFGYARLGDAAATGSSLMPQKKNPDPFELVRAAAARTLGTYAGALASTTGIGLSYHRDLQETKAPDRARHRTRAGRARCVRARLRAARNSTPTRWKRAPPKAIPWRPTWPMR